MDHDTASTIVQKLFNGPLIESRKILLVTHRIDLCHHLAVQVIEIVDGTAYLLDTSSSISDDLTRLRSWDSAATTTKLRTEEQEGTAVPEKFLEEEKREHGGVKTSVYWEYVKAGKIKWWALLIGVLVAGRLIDVGETWFLKQWGESYNRPSEAVTSGLFDNLPSPERNIRPWLLGFFYFAIALSVIFLISQWVMLIVIYSAGRQMFGDVMNRVSHATFRFYDVTPVGRLMNRMTSDIGTVDGNISGQFSAVAWLLIRWIASIIIIASVTPVFLVFAVALTACFVVIFNCFLPTSQSLRRLEVCKMPPDTSQTFSADNLVQDGVFEPPNVEFWCTGRRLGDCSRFGSILSSLDAPNPDPAFAVQSLFQDRVIEVTDAFQKMDHFYW